MHIHFKDATELKTRKHKVDKNAIKESITNIDKQNFSEAVFDRSNEDSIRQNIELSKTLISDKKVYHYYSTVFKM